MGVVTIKKMITILFLFVVLVGCQLNEASMVKCIVSSNDGTMSKNIEISFDNVDIVEDVSYKVTYRPLVGKESLEQHLKYYKDFFDDSFENTEGIDYFASVVGETFKMEIKYDLTNVSGYNHFSKTGLLLRHDFISADELKNSLSLKDQCK